MNSAIQSVVAQYADLYIETLAERFSLPRDQLGEIWKDTLKIKLRKRSLKSAASPPSAYILFCKDHRQQVKEKNPNVGFGDVARILGEMWRQLNTNDKQRYQDLRQQSVDAAAPVAPVAPVAPAAPVVEEKPKKRRAKAT